MGQRHHSDPMFMGGPRIQPRTDMSTFDHQQLHRDLNNFLRRQENEFGQHMRPQRGNSGRDVQENFTRNQRLDALRRFYNEFGIRHPEAARDFFFQHPNLNFCD